MVDVLVLAWRDQIGFVPDADVAAAADISMKLRHVGPGKVRQLPTRRYTIEARSILLQALEDRACGVA
jgi:hypothetical protein